jgi:hypothetical protein
MYTLHVYKLDETLIHMKNQLDRTRELFHESCNEVLSLKSNISDLNGSFWKRLKILFTGVKV